MNERLKHLEGDTESKNGDGANHHHCNHAQHQRLTKGVHQETPPDLRD